MSRLARAYLEMTRLRGRARMVADAVETGVWLGIMGRRTLHALDDEFYRRRGGYAGDRHNLRGLFDWEEEAVAAHFRGCGSLLVVGAGGGREVLALAARGHRVEGYECNPALVEYAAALLARQGCDAPVRLLARDAAPAEGGPFDGVVVGWSAYMLIAGRDRRVGFLRALRERVVEGAPVLLSFWTREPASTRARIVAAVGGPLRRALGREPLEPGDDLSPNFVHRFTGDEIEAELRDGGFRPVRFEAQGPGPYDSGWAVGVAEAREPETRER